MDLDGRVAVVTGAGRGLGPLLCERLAAEGMRVALVARTEPDLEAVAARIGAQGGPAALPVPADLTQPEQVEAMARRVEAELGTPYLLVNSMNVNVFGLGSPFEQSTVEQFDHAMGAKPRGYYLAMRALLPAMLERREGCIVNIASGSGVSGAAGFALFSASEFAIVGLTDSVAREVQDRGVRVTALCPWGIIDSERVRRLLPDRDPDDFMDPADLVETIVFLAKRSPRAWIREVIVRAPSAVE